MRLRLFFSLAALESLICAIYLLSMPAEAKNVILLGYSARRLAVIGMVILLFILCSALTWLVQPSRWVEWLRKQQTLLGWLIFLSSFFFLLGWILVFTPPYRFHPYHLIFKSLLPVWILLTLISLQTSLWLMVIRYGFDWKNLKTALKEQRSLVRSAATIFTMMLLGWTIIALTRLGITPDIAFWNTVGVPLLCPLTLIGWAAGMFLLFFGQSRTPSSVEGIPYRLSRGLQIFQQPNWRVDFFIMMGIFIFSAVLWLAQPVQPTFFAPGPSLPNNEIYPYSDAAGYDLAAQFALIGQGLMGGNAVDKPLYSAFLFVLHLLAGQNYPLLTALQTVIFAIIPVLVFLITKAITDRIGGLTASLLVAFKTATAITSAGLILYANPRLLLSELPTAIGLLFFTLWVIHWAKNPKGGWLYLVLAGGTTGLLTLVRHNTWILLPFMLVFLFWNYRRKLPRAAAASLLFSGALMISILPWMLRYYSLTGSPWYFLGTMRSVVFDKRYELTDQTGAIPLNLHRSDLTITGRGSSGGAAGVEKFILNINEPCRDIDTLSSLPTGTYDDRQAEIAYCGQWKAIKKQPAYLRTLMISATGGDSVYLKFIGNQILIQYLRFEKGGKLDIFIDGNLIDQIDTYQAGEAAYRVSWVSPRLSWTADKEHLLVLTHAGGGSVALDGFIIQNTPLAQLAANVTRTIRLGASFIPQHFFHNLVTTVLILPSTPINDDIDHLVKDENSLWQNPWDGRLNPGQAVWLLVNLALLSVGLAYTWTHHRLTGLVPLLVYLVYNLGTAIARTSGGRYIAPIDWVILLYYAAGLVQISRFAITPFDSQFALSPQPKTISPEFRLKSWKPIMQIAGCLAGLFLLGSFPLIVEALPSPVYPDLSSEQKIDLLEEHGTLSQAGIQAEELQQFLAQPNAVIWHGRALYPRFNYMNKGEPSLGGAYRILGFPRLSFTMIGPDGLAGVVLPASGDRAYPQYFPHAADVTVIGCFNGEYIDAVVVQVQSAETHAYFRSPSAPLNCPLPEPVCENDTNCH